MIFCEENIENPELLEGDPIDSVMYDDQEFMDQLMGTYSTSEDGILSANGGGGGGGNFKEVTKAYYDSLSDEEKKNGTVYFIKDWVPNI